MDFQDFCRYFTDVVVCRLVERTLLWSRSHWREVKCFGEWALAPVHPGAPPCIRHHSNTTLSKNNVRPEGTRQRGSRKEAQLGETHQEGRKGGDCDAGKIRKKGTTGLEESGAWEVSMDRRSRCGGCINHRDTFLYNPQFMFEVQNKEEELLICLQQEDRRIWKKNGGGDNLPIGFEVLKVEANRSSRVQRVVEQAASSIYMDSRSVTLRRTLAPGRYVVVPTTFLPGAIGRFLLRLFSHSRIKLRELKDEVPSPSLLQCFLSQPIVVTTVHLRRAFGLGPPKETAPNVYAVLRCESDTVRTRVLREERNPEFNLRTIFYRRYPDVHISIELWIRGLLWDSLIGTAHIQTSEPERSRNLVIDLRGESLRSGSRCCIHVETSSSICLTDL